jgi:hypothetical protein
VRHLRHQLRVAAENEVGIANRRLKVLQVAIAGRRIRRAGRRWKVEGVVHVEDERAIALREIFRKRGRVGLPVNEEDLFGGGTRAVAHEIGEPSELAPGRDGETHANREPAASSARGRRRHAVAHAFAVRSSPTVKARSRFTRAGV